MGKNQRIVGRRSQYFRQRCSGEPCVLSSSSTACLWSGVCTPQCFAATSCMSFAFLCLHALHVTHNQGVLQPACLPAACSLCRFLDLAHALIFFCSAVGPGGVGPAWTRGAAEKPLGEKNMGTWVARVYTADQQVSSSQRSLGGNLCICVRANLWASRRGWASTKWATPRTIAPTARPHRRLRRPSCKRRSPHRGLALPWSRRALLTHTDCARAFSLAAR